MNLQNIISQRDNQESETKSLRHKLELLESTTKKQIYEKDEQVRTLRIKFEQIDPTFRRQLQ